jgi:hypothetical protein
MALYTGVPLETLAEALSLAQAALPLVARGESVGALATGDQRITFVPTTPAALEKHIRDLQAAIAALTSGALARKGFYIGGGKGL